MSKLLEYSKVSFLAFIIFPFFITNTLSQEKFVSTSVKPYKLELVLGKSMVLKLMVPVKKKLRVSVGAPEIADCLVIPPREIYIQAKKAGLTNIIIWQEDKLIAIYEVEVQYDVSRLKEKLFQILPHEKELKVVATNESITLLGKISNPANLSQAIILAKSFAPEGNVNNMVQVGGTHQVMLEVKMAEMARSVGKDLGIDLSFFNDGDIGMTRLEPLGFTSPLTGTTISSAVNALFRFSSGNTTWTAFIKALKEDGLAKILAEPNLICLSGQTASFLAGGEFPIPVPDENGITVDYKEFGVGLRFSPTVLDKNKISIKVDSEVSELDFTTAVRFSGFVIPGVTTRRAATTIELADGQSFAIAGLLSESVKENVKKFPYLNKIPLLGSLFKSTSFQKNETELVIIVTPRFVKPLDNTNQALPTDYYDEPTDSEIYLNLGKKANKSSGNANMGTLDGKFGHTFEEE